MSNSTKEIEAPETGMLSGSVVINELTTLANRFAEYQDSTFYSVSIVRQTTAFLTTLNQWIFEYDRIDHNTVHISRVITDLTRAVENYSVYTDSTWYSVSIVTHTQNFIKMVTSLIEKLKQMASSDSV